MVYDSVELGLSTLNPDASKRGPFFGQIQELLINNFKYLELVDQTDLTTYVNVTATKVEEDVEITSAVSLRSAAACVAVKNVPTSSGELRISFRFKTHFNKGLILYRSVPGGGDFIAVELTGTGQLRVVFNSLLGADSEAKYIDSSPLVSLNDNQWHSVSFQRVKESDYLFINNLYIDGAPITVRTGQPGSLQLTGDLFVGGVYREVYHLLHSSIRSLDGFVGCLDSMHYNNMPINLGNATKIVEPKVVFRGCGDSKYSTLHRMAHNHNQLKFVSVSKVPALET